MADDELQQARIKSSGRDPWPDVPEARRSIMRANKRRDTGPELLLRSALHRSGLRFRVDFPIRPGGGRLVRPDVVFTRRRIAVYVDGCFWHGCPVHWRPSRTNSAYWDEKVIVNRERDAQITQVLEADGWTVFRFWEHESMIDAAQTVREAVRRLG